MTKKTTRKPELEHAELLKSWLGLNARLMKLKEKEVLELLEHEKISQARLRVLLRLYHRFSKLRGIREKSELGRLANG